MDWTSSRAEVEARLAAICTALPEVHEGPNPSGRSWLIRTNHFCQVHTVDQGDTEAGMLVFRSAPPELDALIASGHPFFFPGWGRRVVGMMMTDGIDWEEVTELITDSYCIQAPKKLAARVRSA
jgi:hypothetical protein